MNRILVPTDFSAYSLKALNYAIELSKKTGATVSVLHVCDLIDSRFSSIKGIIDEQNEELQRELWGKLRQLQQSVEETEKVHISTHLYNGNITESIIEEARKNNTDLIVMGTLGAAGLKEKILGSKATQVIRHSPVAVLCVPIGYEWMRPEKIMLAVNELPHRHSVNTVVGLCRAFGAQLQVVSLSEKNAEGFDVMEHSRTLELIREKLQKENIDVEVVTKHLTGTHFYETALDYLREEKIDLLAMVPRHRDWLTYITGKSMTQKFASYGDVPLLTLNEPEAA